MKVGAAPLVRRRALQAGLLLILLACLAAALWSVQADWGALWRGRESLGRFLGGLWPPVLSLEFLGFLVRPLGETLALSVAGTTLAIVLAWPLALAATGRIGDGRLAGMRSGPQRRLDAARYVAARTVLNGLRAVPDLVWALLFVVVVGLGMVPGVLAIGVAYAGMLGKLYAEILEGMDARPLEALAASGAGRFATFLYAAIPQAWPQLVSFTLYAWECAMRAAALMGFVGAGGLGYQLDLSMRMFEFGEVATLLVALVLLVTLVDAVSALSRRLMVGSHDARRLGPRARRAAKAALGIGALLAVGFSAWAVAGPVAQALGAGGVERVGRFVAGAWPPDSSADFLGMAFRALLETLAIAFVGTAIGGVIGALAAGTATRSLFVQPPVIATGARAWRHAVYTGMRGMLSALRAVPELFWALILILAVGVGPFAGALALGVHTGGILGKLYADTLEAADARPLEALLVSGAPVSIAALYATLPLSLPVLSAHTIYRFEMNLRAAAVLGIVGGGGLGQAIYTTTQLGFHDRLLTLIVLLWALVTLVDGLGAWVRARLSHGTGV